MSGKYISFNRPKDWQAFERLTRDLFVRLHGNIHFDLHGRGGQNQSGVDVLGRDSSGQWIGVQCKGKEDASFNAHKGASETELRSEINKARRFNTQLGLFVFLTTGPNNAKLKEIAREISEDHAKQGLFRIEFHGWDWIESKLSDHLDLATNYGLASVLQAESVAPSPIAAQIGQRLQAVLDLINAKRFSSDTLTLQGLARRLDMKDWRKLEQIAAGLSNNSFDEIANIADHLGISAEWLLEGKRSPFEPDSQFFNGALGHYEVIKRAEPRTIYFVRSRGPKIWSNAIICLILDDVRWRTFGMLYPIRAQVGAGGSAQIFEFCCLVRRLRLDSSRYSWQCKGRHVTDDEFEELLSGQVYPGTILMSGLEDYWWDDFGDQDASRLSGDVPHMADLSEAITIARWGLKSAQADAEHSPMAQEKLAWAGFL